MSWSHEAAEDNLHVWRGTQESHTTTDEDIFKEIWDTICFSTLKEVIRNTGSVK